MGKFTENIFQSSKKWILVMHEDSVARTDTRRMLEKSGYRVYLAGCGDDVAECYSVARNYGYPFAAVIMDASASEGARGRDAIKTLLDIDPDVRAIVVGGHRKDPVMVNFKEYGFRGALTKSFTGEELDQVLRGVLNAGMEKS